MHLLFCSVALAFALPFALRAQAVRGDPFPKRTSPYLAVYRWGAANSTGGAGANEAFAKWLSPGKSGTETTQFPFSAARFKALFGPAAAK